MHAPAATEAEQRAALAHLDLRAVVAAPGHHCLYPRFDEPCAGAAACTDLAERGERPGFRCRNCGRWGETIAGIDHARQTCTPALNPPRVRKPRRSPLLGPAPKPAGYSARRKKAPRPPTR